MSFGTISTFSSLKFPSSGINIIYVYPNLDSSMSVYYTFDFASNNSLPNYYNLINGITIYDTIIIGNNNITNDNYISGKGALQLTNNENTVATQYVQKNTTTNIVNNNNCLSISIWFNPTNLNANNLYTLFDIIGNVGNNGIQIDLSGTNSICYGYYDIFTTNFFFNVDSNMIIYYPLSYNIYLNTIPNYYNANNSSIIYDGTILGDASIANNNTNSIIGNGGLQLTNTSGNIATQFVRNNSPINTNGLNGLTISIWFNPTTILQNNNMYTLFNIANNIDNKSIQLDLSGINMICSELFY
jgi:hypothetical protein